MKQAVKAMSTAIGLFIRNFTIIRKVLRYHFHGGFMRKVYIAGYDNLRTVLYAVALPP